MSEELQKVLEEAAIKGLAGIEQLIKAAPDAVEGFLKFSMGSVVIDVLFCGIAILLCLVALYAGHRFRRYADKEAGYQEGAEVLGVALPLCSVITFIFVIFGPTRASLIKALEIKTSPATYLYKQVK